MGDYLSKFGTTVNETRAVQTRTRLLHTSLPQTHSRGSAASSQGQPASQPGCSPGMRGDRPAPPVLFSRARDASSWTTVELNTAVPAQARQSEHAAWDSSCKTAFAAKHPSLPRIPAPESCHPPPTCRVVKLSTTNTTQHNCFSCGVQLHSLRRLMRFPFLHTETTFLKPSESKSCFPRNAEAMGPSLFLSSSCLETSPTAAPPSPSSLNLPVAPALEYRLAERY